MNANADDRQLADGRQAAQRLHDAVSSVVVGQGDAIALLNCAIHARGHVLLQGDVGVGKTTLLRAFARGLGGAYGRIEGTVDLLPNDLLYHAYITPDGKPAIEPGPLTRAGSELAIFFFNEINRARPQVHALLLRVMAERSVSAFNRDIALPLVQVFADRNRLEREETFEIASAARDRFMMEITIDAPQADADRLALAFDPRFHDADGLIAQVPTACAPIADVAALAPVIQRSIHASPALQNYVLRLWRATERPAASGVVLAEAEVGDLIAAGASPRGVSSLMRAARVWAWLQGRDHVRPDDVRAVFAPCMAHRISLAPMYEMRRDQLMPALVGQLLARIDAP